MIYAALTTYERESFLKITAGSLACSAVAPGWELHVFDDASPTLGVEQIRTMFPHAVTITRRPNNLGADNHMRQVMLDFLQSSSSHLFLLDGDLLLNTDWHSRATAVLQRGIEVLSLYNSALHDTIDTIVLEDETLVVKRDLGAAGAILSRHIVEEIVANVPASRTFDWDWSDHLTKRGVRLHALQRGAVQHIGLSGTNSSLDSVDYGLGFVPDNTHDLEHCVQFLERLLQNVHARNTELKRRVDVLEDTVARRVGRLVRRPWLIPRKVYARLMPAVRRSAPS